MDFTTSNVYIIFGDSPRSDGSNVYGVYREKASAEEELRRLQTIKPEEFISIEKFVLFE